MRVGLYRSRGFVSWAIRFQTRGQYSHAALLLDDRQAIEAWHKGGVQKGAMGHLQAAKTQIDVYEITGDFDKALALEFAEAQVGKPYDFKMVGGFVSRRSREGRRSTGKWFCSELVYATLEKAGLRLFNRTQAWEVSPDLLKRSPYLLYSHTERVK